ncbi:MAG: thiol peroxidase [Crocinitomicaceae bacterium]|nr:thiol peroxidase [Crocinitomicaceae bacterium]
MATVTLKGNELHTNGNLPEVGATLPNATLVGKDLSRVDLSSYKGQRLILNIFPSIDTGTCAASVRTFNQKAADLENTTVLCISRDLPFAQGRFCGSEGIENVITLSDFESGEFGNTFGVNLEDGPLKGLHARSVVVVDEEMKVVHTELVPEIVDEPNYESTLNALK